MDERRTKLLRTALKIIHDGPTKRLDLREIDDDVRAEFQNNYDRVIDFSIDLVIDAIAHRGQFAKAAEA